MIAPAITETGLASCTCTILVPDQVFGDSGAPSGNYTPVTGLQNLPCAVAPLGVGDRVQPTELKEMAEIMSKNPLHVSLLGYYPQIVSGNRCYITFKSGVTGYYEVFGTESNSQAQATRLAVMEITI